MLGQPLHRIALLKKCTSIQDQPLISRYRRICELRVCCKPRIDCGRVGVTSVLVHHLEFTSWLCRGILHQSYVDEHRASSLKHNGVILLHSLNETLRVVLEFAADLREASTSGRIAHCQEVKSEMSNTLNRRTFHLGLYLFCFYLLGLFSFV